MKKNISETRPKRNIKGLLWAIFSVIVIGLAVIPHCFIDINKTHSEIERTIIVLCGLPLGITIIIGLAKAFGMLNDSPPKNPPTNHKPPHHNQHWSDDWAGGGPNHKDGDG